jgi:hypothetical protein
MEKILIGGKALIALGSSRGTEDTDYLICDPKDRRTFIHDEENIDLINGGGCMPIAKFFKKVYEAEKGKEVASAQSLLDLKAFAYIQHVKNGFGQKADDAEFDMKFLVRNFGVTGLKLAFDFLTPSERETINKIISSTIK